MLYFLEENVQHQTLNKLFVFITIIEALQRNIVDIFLILSWWRSLSYRNQSINLLCKSIDWFLYGWTSVMEELNIFQSGMKQVGPS